MTAEPTTVGRPLHPLPEMTTYELTAYRRNLEREIPRMPEPDRTVLQRRLDEALAEQDERQRIRDRR